MDIVVNAKVLIQNAKLIFQRNFTKLGEKLAKDERLGLLPQAPGQYPTILTTGGCFVVGF